MRSKRVTAACCAAFSILVSTTPWSPLVHAQRQAVASTPDLRDLNGLTGLQSLFDREVNRVRVIMLLSPT
jgi:hypothetical protein